MELAERIAGTILRAACERSKGAGSIRTRDEGGRQQPFTAGLARFFASVWERQGWRLRETERLEGRNGAGLSALGF